MPHFTDLALSACKTRAPCPWLVQNGQVRVGFKFAAPVVNGSLTQRVYSMYSAKAYPNVNGSEMLSSQELDHDPLVRLGLLA